jgi:hypothetical protein
MASVFSMFFGERLQAFPWRRRRGVLTAGDPSRGTMDYLTGRATSLLHVPRGRPVGIFNLTT